MFGVTEEGHSVCCHVHGFSPYFYVSLPEKFQPIHCGEFKTALNKELMNDLKSNRERISEPVLDLHVVDKINIFGYHGGNKTLFAKIVLAIPRLIAPAKRLLELGQVSTPSLGSCAYQAYESNVDFETRFSVDNDVVGCNWIQLIAGTYSRRAENSS